MAAKKKGKKAAPAKAASKLPKGFTAIGGLSSSWPNDTTKPGEVIVGTIVSFDEKKVQRGKRKEKVKLLELETTEGKKLTLWQSAGLSPLFDLPAGTRVRLEYLGMGVAKPGQNAPRLYALAVAEGRKSKGKR